MSDSETAMAVAAAIAALRDDEEEQLTQAVQNGTASTENAPGVGTASAEGGENKEEEMQTETAPPPPPPKPKTKVLSCLICTQAITPENTKLGSSNSSSEYERMMRIVCKLLCVDNHPMLKQWKFRHSDESKKLCCDECCEVVFNLGSLQSIIDRTKLAINKKLDWILKTVSDTAAEESEDIEKVFFAARSDVFRTEILEVCKRKKNASNGFGDSDDEEEELVNKGVQTDISGESGVSEKTTKAGLKSFESRSSLPSFSFDDNMDTYSDHNDDMSFNNSYSYDNDDSNLSFGSKSETKKNTAKRTPSSSQSKPASASRGRGRPPANKRPLKFEDDDDDDIEVLEEKRAPKSKGPGRPSTKAKIDPRDLLKVEYNSEPGGRPKRSAAAKRPNYQALMGDDDDYIPSVKRTSTPSSSLSAVRKPTPKKEVTLSAIPIVKDASGRTYFEGVEIVRTDKSITCKHLGCYYVVDGSGYNAFERIKKHIHDTHITDGIPDVY